MLFGRITLGVGTLILTIGVFFAFKYSPRHTTIVQPPLSATANNTAVAPVPSSPTTILFGGDIFLDRLIRRRIEENGQDYLWTNIAPFLQSFEYKVANLEGPIWSQPEATPLEKLSFAFQPEYIPKLKELGFTALSLANNHTDNKGPEALKNTRDTLAQVGIEYFGDPINNPAFLYLQKNFSEKKIALVGEHDLIPQGQEEVLALIARLKAEGNFVVVYPHWGAEYVLDIPAQEKERAHALVDAGADLVIGSHPHVVQPIEVYRQGVIFYSLGNFLFDQYFSYDTMHGLLVEVRFESDGVRYLLHPTEQLPKTYGLSLAPTAAKEKMLERLSAASQVTKNLRDGIRGGEFFVEH